MAYDDNNQGAVFVNDRKEKDTHPDRTGSAKIDGVDYFVDGWLKESKGGKKFLSLRFKRKDKQSGAQQPTQGQRTPPPRKAAPPAPPSDPEPQYPEETDDIPF